MREEFLTELYMGINVMINDSVAVQPYEEFKTRMKDVPTEELRLQVLELRKIIQK